MAKYTGYARPKDKKKTMKKMLHYMGIYKWSMVLVGILVCISSLANILGTYMLKPVINRYILPGNIPGLIRILILMAVMYGFRGAGHAGLQSADGSHLPENRGTHQKGFV